MAVPLFVGGTRFDQLSNDCMPSPVTWTLIVKRTTKYKGALKGDLIDQQLRLVDNQGDPATSPNPLFPGCPHARPQEDLFRAAE